MKQETCAGCPFSKKIKPKTKPFLICTRGRYGQEPKGGFPVAWIKKCEHDEKMKEVRNEKV